MTTPTRDLLEKHAIRLQNVPLELSNEQLGSLLREYVTVSVYETNWEGFSKTDLIGIEKLLTDMYLVQENSK